MKPSRIISSILICASLTTPFPILADEAPPAYDGSDMTIAILDRGFDLTHESFVITDKTPKLTKEVSDTLIPSTTFGSGDTPPTSVYINAKIPLAYDYGDGDTDVSHQLFAANGTALISVAAGNGKLLAESVTGATGIAPEAQILAMKVHSDKTGAVTAEAMTAAINDAVTLGADVILIGVTSMDGFGSAEEMAGVNAAIENAEANGAIVVTAAGSTLKYGTGSVYDTEYEMLVINADSPDVGTIAWPGSLKATLTVGSADSNVVESDFFTHISGIQIPYGDSNYMYPATTGGVSFDKFFDGRTLEYVMVRGRGTAEDYAAAGDLTGKLAVIERGELTFSEKAINAAASGAIGLIVVDNQPDDNLAPSIRMDLTDSPIPAIIISSSNGVKLKSAEDKRIAVKDGETYTTYTRDTPSLSANSPYGSTPELSLKPDIMAIGGNVECATVDNGYTFASSTRIAAAKVAGMCVCVKARFMYERPDADSSELTLLTRAALVSSAQLMRRASLELYSPRVQGGGAADLDAALEQTLILTADGSYKIELGEFSRLVSFKLTAKNLSDTAKVCTLSATVGSDGFDKLTYEQITIAQKQTPLHERLGHEKDDTVAFTAPFTQLAGPKVMLGDIMYQLNCASPDYDPYTLTLAPGASTTFFVTLYIDDETYKSYSESFTNGFFIEGFMRLTSEDEAASIPFLGFVGDYDSAPSLDASIYDGEQYIYSPIYLYRYSSTAGTEDFRAILGNVSNGFDLRYDINSLAFSPTYERDSAQIILNLGLRRSIRDVSVTVTSPDGSVISHRELGELMRTYSSSSTGMLTSPQIVLWDGRDPNNPSYIYPDGDYTVTLSYRTALSDTLHKLTYTIHLDTAAPTLYSYEFTKIGEVSSLRIIASDNFRLSGVRVVDNELAEAEQSYDGTWDIGCLYGEYIYIELYDLASNSTVVRLKNPYFGSDS